MKTLFYLILLFPCFLFSLEIVSGMAHYTGEEIVLDGGVVLDRGEGRELRCARGHLYPQDHLGEFFGGEGCEHVRYTEPIREHLFVMEAGSLAVRMDPKSWEMREMQANGGVVIASPLGKLTTEKGLCATWGKDKEIRHITCLGETTLRCYQEDEEVYLICYGDLFLDHEKRTITMNSPQNTEGEVEEDVQLFFEDGKGKMFSDHAVLAYAVIEDQFTPLQLTLEGNVRMYHREGPLLQYALADRSVFFVEKQEVHFKALETKRVLFYDRVNQLTMSAPEVKVKRDPSTKKDSVQGVGDVRFYLDEEELHQLRQRISAQ